MLEGSIWDAATKDIEKLNGCKDLGVLEFDVTTEKWTDRHSKYMLETNGFAISD
jgi:hypothetical protein